MITEQLKLVVSGAFDEERLDELNDEDLLQRFLNRDNAAAEAAFHAIVARHGPMVLGVCRHILNQLQDAEDAFQATFLVLARKAGSIRDRRVLARWLYEVAYRIAVRARTNGVRRRAHERQGGEMSATVTIDNHGWIELRPVLHEEVNRLPEKYRVPVILCYLEGKTNEEAAEILQWPVGTVKGRLSRARDMLHARLTRRGLALSAAFLVTALSSGTVIADMVPPRLLNKTVAGAMAVAQRDPSGPASIAPEVSQLMDFASTAAGSSKGAMVAMLVVVIAGALVSLGFTVAPQGLRFDSNFSPAAFFSAFGRPPANPNAVAAAGPACGCQTAECATTPANP